MKCSVLRVLVWISAVLLMSSCGSAGKVSNYNVSSLYNPGQNYLLPRVNVFHTSDSFSEISVKIPCTEYLSAGDAESPTAEIRIEYAITPPGLTSQIIDSGSFVFMTDTGNVPEFCNYTFFAGIPDGGIYTGIIRALVRGREQSYVRIVDVLKRAPSRQDYLLTDENDNALFSDILERNEDFRIRLRDRGKQHLYVRYYSRKFPVALPPFAYEKDAVFDYKADSLYRLPLSDGLSGTLNLAKPGFYHFQSDTTIRNGITVFILADEFPAVTTPMQMLEPLRYLTTSREYSEMEKAANPKMVIDSFWLANAGNVDRARNLVRQFYSRVEEANALFTSYHEGWKTDRGMIYIIYGHPDIVYKAVDSEKWLYGEQGNPRSVSFRFTHVDNPFSDEDYVLVKSPVYKESWYNAVENWRR